MSETRANAKPVRRAESRAHGGAKRMYESETLVLQSLRLIAAPDPRDDLSDAELEAICKDPSRSQDLIKHLIDCIKTI
jgi:hypothetical protein